MMSDSTWLEKTLSGLLDDGRITEYHKKNITDIVTTLTARLTLAEELAKAVGKGDVCDEKDCPFGCPEINKALAAFSGKDGE